MRLLPVSFLPVFLLLCLLALTAFAAALMAGARFIPAETVWQALTARDAGDPGQAVVLGLRLPRALAGVLCGAALAAAGVVMQALTRNPLADPGLMGVNAGAALAVVAVLWLTGRQEPLLLAGAAMCGAGLAAVAVWRLAGGQEAAVSSALTTRLPLAGMAISSLCMALVAAVVLLNTETRDVYRFWMAGSLVQADPDGLRRLAPAAALGLLLALASARGLGVLSLGSGIAAGLGLRPGLVAGAALGAVTLLSGAAVALAGPLGFVGLIVPHAARALGGADLRRVLVLSLPLGAAVLLAADAAGRVAARPSEIAAGIVLALAGGPAFMLMLRRVLGGAG